AVAAGAAAGISGCSGGFYEAGREVPHNAVVGAGHGRAALAAVSANFFSHPERALALSGVTGTNGKTTTAFLLDAMLNHAGRKTVLVGTIEYHVVGAGVGSPHP